MKRRTLLDTISPEEREFIEAGTPQPRKEPTTPTQETPPVPKEEQVAEQKPAERRREKAPELPTVLISQTYRLPTDLVKDLTRVAVERKLNRTAPWSQQDIVAEAVREWISKHASKQASI
jgi:hypothetical protein